MVGIPGLVGEGDVHHGGYTRVGRRREVYHGGYTRVGRKEERG